LSQIIANWHEESRLSSPGNGGNDRPKNEFYLNAAKYNHSKRERPQMANQIVLSIEAETDLGALSDFGN